MQLKFLSPACAVTVTALLVVSACGSRSTLLPGDYQADTKADASVLSECDIDADCSVAVDLCAPLLCLEHQCVQRFTVCNDGDPCTTDSCEPSTGKCVTAPATLDLDGDGHNGPLPGTVPGAPGSCGDDCDDTRASAFPGNLEVCDSVDNDCNGVVDDGAGYAPPAGGLTDVRVSGPRFENASPSGLAHDGQKYFAVYSGPVQSKSRVFGSFLQTDGTRIGEESRLVQVESDAYSSSIVWTGDRYGMVFSDRRYGNYEMFFATFDANGKKRAPGDVRLSNTDAFSINSDLVWTGSEFVAVWQDGTGNNGSFGTVARRIGLDGQLLSEPITLASNGESPRIAVGRPGLGLVYNVADNDQHTHVLFRAFDFALAPLSGEQSLDSSVPGEYPGIEWNRDVFVVTWEGVSSSRQIYGATFDGLGNAVTPLRQMTASPANARFPAIVPLGDRLLMVYSDTRDGNDGYELYTQTYGADLVRIGLPTRITNSIGVSSYPVPISGPEGEIGVLFSDKRGGSSQTYFTRLVCDAPVAGP